MKNPLRLLLEKEVILSDNLISILKKMNDPIANNIISLQGKSDMPYSFIEADEEHGMVSYLPANREKGLTDSEKWEKGRQNVKIGRFVRAVLDKEKIKFTEFQIDQFVNKYVAVQRESNNQYTFKLVKGAEITKWYCEDNYHGKFEESHTLWNSCMRYQTCQTFFKVYERTPSVKLLILLDNTTGKLVGRALVWTDCIPLDKTNPFIFMDRIYCYKTYMEELFKNYAKERNWWWKEQQDSGEMTGLTNGRVGRIRRFKVEIDSLEPGEDRPYADTLKYYAAYDGIVTNDENHEGITEVWEDTDGFFRPLEDDIDAPIDNFDDFNPDEHDFLKMENFKLKNLKTFESYFEDDEDEEEDEIHQIFNKEGKKMIIDVEKLTEYIKNIDNRIEAIRTTFSNSPYQEDIYLKIDFYKDDEGRRKMYGEPIDNTEDTLYHEVVKKGIGVQQTINRSDDGWLALKFSFTVEEIRPVKHTDFVEQWRG